MKITFRCPEELLDHLPRPIPAKRRVPDWYKQMPMNAFSPDLDQDVQTLKQCPPFLDAMTYGFIIPLPVNVKVDNMEFSWNWDVPQPSDGPGHTDIGLYSQSPLGSIRPRRRKVRPISTKGSVSPNSIVFGQCSLK